MTTLPPGEGKILHPKRLHADPPGIAGADVIGPGKGALIDGNGHAVQAVDIGQGFPDVDIGKAFGQGDDIPVHRPGIVFNGDAEPVPIPGAGFQEQLPGDIGPEGAEADIQHIHRAADGVAV